MKLIKAALFLLGAFITLSAGFWEFAFFMVGSGLHMMRFKPIPATPEPSPAPVQYTGNVIPFKRR